MIDTRLPAGYRIERDPLSETLVYFRVYKDGYEWANGDPRPVRSVMLTRVKGGHEISSGLMENYSVEAALAYCAALAHAINEAHAGPPRG